MAYPVPNLSKRDIRPDSGQVRPTAPQNQRPDGGGTDTVLSPHAPDRALSLGVAIANRDDLFFGEYGPASLDAPQDTFRLGVCAAHLTPSDFLRMGVLPVPLLSKHVGNVLSLSASEQMASAGARVVIATMQHLKSLADGADLKFVGEAVGANVPAIMVETTVAVGPHSANPGPALPQLRTVLGDRTIPIDLLPESFFNGPLIVASSVNTTPVAAISSAASLDPERASDERLGAVNADAINEEAWLCGTFEGHSCSPYQSEGVSPRPLRAVRGHFCASIIAWKRC